MVAFFDVGSSVALTDGAFDPEQLRPIRDIFAFSYVNPLGQGVLADMLVDSPGVVRAWRAAALAQVRRPELPLDWTPALGMSEEDYLTRLEAAVAGHALEECTVTVFGIGTALLSLRFSEGLDRRLILGVLRCFEYAAYLPDVSESIRATAAERVRVALLGEHRGLAVLARRPVARVLRDLNDYQESELFTSFSYVVICVKGQGQPDDVTWLLEDWFFAESDRLAFAEADLYASWWANIVVLGDSPLHDPLYGAARPLMAIEVAHTFQGACLSLENLLRAEIAEQVDSFGSDYTAGRSLEELNQLRTLALAVVALTTFSSVSQTIWERSYFAAYEERALISEQHRRIIQACDTLYSSQVAQSQHEDAKRQKLLNGFLLLLTSLTLVSVNADAYAFVRDEDPLLSERLPRLLILLLLIVGIGVFVGTAARRARVRRRPRA